MPYRLAALPVLALLFGALDTLLVRHQFAHRDLGAELFGQACLLWLALGALSLVPAGLWSAWRARRRPERPPPSAPAAVASQAAWTAGPVLLHMSLDRHTDLGGDLTGLLSFGAVLDLVLTAAALVLMARGGRALLARLGTRRVGAVLALVAALAGLLVRFHAEPRLSPPEESPAAADRPNVLLMIWDTSRAKSVNLYGYARETTPFLNDLASSSVLFKFARSVSSYTLTSHLSMLTGVYPSHHGARLMRQVYDPDKTPSVAEDFAAAGYRTGAFVGTGVLSARTGTIAGFEVFDDLVDPPVCDTRAWALVHDVQAVLSDWIPALKNNGMPHWFQDFQRPASSVLASATAWLERPDPRPWFCMINMYDVHWPYLPGAEAVAHWVEPYDGPASGYLSRADGWDEEYQMEEADRVHVRDLYDAELWELDRQVRAFVERLDLDRTALVITSDHGEAFGEGGQWEHNDILECQLRVPLLVRPAGGVAGREDRTPVSGVDVAPTLLDLAGLLDPQPAAESGAGRFKGHSVLRAPAERDLLVEDRDHLDWDDVRIALYHDRWKLVRLGLGDEAVYQLHDLKVDPNGVNDVIAENPEVAERLRERLDALRATWNADDEADRRAAGGFSNAAALRALGYLGGDEEAP